MVGDSHKGGTPTLRVCMAPSRFGLMLCEREADHTGPHTALKGLVRWSDG